MIRLPGVKERCRRRHDTCEPRRVLHQPVWPAAQHQLPSQQLPAHIFFILNAINALGQELIDRNGGLAALEAVALRRSETADPIAIQLRLSQ